MVTIKEIFNEKNSFIGCEASISASQEILLIIGDGIRKIIQNLDLDLDVDRATHDWMRNIHFMKFERKVSFLSYLNDHADFFSGTPNLSRVYLSM